MPIGHGGLTSLALGLFHPYKKVRFAVADLLERIDTHPVRLSSSSLIVGRPTLYRLNESISKTII